MPAAATSDSLIGFTLVNKYKVLRQIGRGGMGVVYEAEHVELGKRVAIKLMLEKYAEDGEAIARFKREALAASRIGNPHIIDVSDIGTAPDGRSFVVMELLIGTSLSDLIEKGGAMTPWRALQIMRQVLRAVGAAHAKNIVHRDLKPDNIFLVNQDDHHDFVKLLDFGISKVIDQAAEIAATKLTTTGMVMGTPLYMAPEQAMGATTDHHADIYALGVILYEMLGGQPPFNGATYPILVAKLLTQDPPLLSEIRPGLPPALVAAVHRALEKEPERRFHSCDEFAKALPKDSAQSGSMEMAQTLDSGSLASAGALGIGASGARSGARSAVQPKQLGVSTLGGSSAGQQVPSTHALPRQGRSKLPIVFGALGVGLAIGAIAIVAMSRGGDDGTAKQPTVTPITEAPKPVAPPPAPPSLTPPPGATTGHIHVKTTPPGASVTIDGQPAGVSPMEMTVTTGTHHVHVELATFKPMDEDVDVAANKDEGANMLLQKAPVVLPVQPKIVKTIHPQDKPHVEPTPPGMMVPVAPPQQQTPPAGPPPNPYDDTKKQPPPPQQGPKGSAKPNPYQ